MPSLKGVDSTGTILDVSTFADCSICFKCLSKSTRSIICISCRYYCAHLICVEIDNAVNCWICPHCYVFPFSEIIDSKDFITAASGFNIHTSPRELKCLALYDNTLSDKNIILNNPTIDPDLNLPTEFDVCKNKYIDEIDLNKFFDFSEQSAINIIHVNCRSLNKNFGGLQSLLNSISNTLTAVAVSETWLTPMNQDFYNITGYTFVCRNRSDGSGGGGAGIYLNNNLLFNIRDDLSVTKDCIECIFVEIVQKKDSNFLIGCVYRPPNTNVASFNFEFSAILNSISSGTLCFILGDFNLDLLKHDTHAPTGTFLNNLISHSFLPTIYYPTRITETSATLIDNIFVNSRHHNYSTANVWNDISDHLPVVIHYSTKLSQTPAQTKTTRRQYNETSIRDFVTALGNTDWSSVCNNFINYDNPTEIYSNFANKFSHLFETHFPLVELKFRKNKCPRKEWITKGLIKSCNKKYTLYKKWLLNPNLENKLKYSLYKNKLKSVLKKAEKDFYFRKLNSFVGNLSETWKVLRGALNNGTRPLNYIGSFEKDGITVDNPQSIVEYFNDYFVNISVNLAKEVPLGSKHFSSYLSNSMINSFSFTPCDTNEVINITHSLNNKNSFGYDSIPLNIVKRCITQIASPLSYIINCSFQTGVFPDPLKIAKVCPIYKSGDKKLFSNYRPISVLPSFSKIFEKAVYNRLESWVKLNNILTDNQYGFRAKHSTSMALLDMIDKVSTSIDKNEFSIGIFIDLSKAFDTINHNILFKKLENYGIRGLPLNWFIDYLSNRKQYVFFNNFQSSLKYVTCGVPQGSILGPLLFILYINDIIKCSTLLKFVLFADDTNLFYSNGCMNDLISTVNLELAKLSEWFRCNKLYLNVKKTNFILFGHKCKRFIDAGFDINIAMEGVRLDRVESTKFLGVYIDNLLNWKQHTTQIALKISKNIYLINRLKKILPLKSLKTLYFTMIHPYFLYCNIVWGCATLVALNKLITLQKRALRIITNSNFRTPSSPLYRMLNVPKLTDIYALQCAFFMYKAKNNLLPPSCLHFITLNNKQHPYFLRRVRDFTELHFKTNVRKRSIAISGPFIWNSIPLTIRESVSFTTFKKLYLHFLISNYL